MDEGFSRELKDLSGAEVRSELAARAASSADTSGMVRIDGGTTRDEVLAAVRGEAVAETATDQLYGAVMNIPCKTTYLDAVVKMAYREGHRDARHAAAGLIAAFSSSARAADAPSEPIELVALTDVDRLRMPKRDAFIKWAKVRALDVSETKDAWGNRSFVHPHIESIWFGWFHAPSVADASQVCKLCNDTGDMSLGPTDSFGRCSCVAADALDSQPTDLPVAEFAEDFIFNLRKQPNGERWPVGTKLYVRIASSQHPDGGVRNGCADVIMHCCNDLTDCANVIQVNQANHATAQKILKAVADIREVSNG